VRLVGYLKKKSITMQGKMNVKLTKYSSPATNISASYKTQRSRVMRTMLLSDT